MHVPNTFKNPKTCPSSLYKASCRTVIGIQHFANVYHANVNFRISNPAFIKNNFDFALKFFQKANVFFTQQCQINVLALAECLFCLDHHELLPSKCTLGSNPLFIENNFHAIGSSISSKSTELCKCLQFSNLIHTKF